MSELKFPVEASHIMMFARAVGDEDPAYMGADPAGTIAPPTFVQSVAQFDPNYYLRPKLGEAWFGSGRTASGVEGPAKSSGGLHAEQHFEYHRHPKPGDILTVTIKPGASWEKESKRAGKLKFSERIAEYRDQHGELVVTARSVAVTTERPVAES